MHSADTNCPATVLAEIESTDGRLGIDVVTHFHVPAAHAQPCLRMFRYPYRFDVTEFSKYVCEILIRRRRRDIADVKFCRHSSLLIAGIRKRRFGAQKPFFSMIG